MPATLEKFCPALDPQILLQFRGDAYQAWIAAPEDQKDFWREEYMLISDLLDDIRSRLPGPH